MPTIQEIVKDPKFYDLPIEERRKVFLRVDPQFERLSNEEQTKVLVTTESQFNTPKQPSPLPQPQRNFSELVDDAMMTSMDDDVTMDRDAIIAGSKKMYRPALEGGGAAIGGLIGAGMGPLGAVGGGALGYGIGRRGASLIDEALGMRQPPSMTELATETGQDLLTGATFEMGGQALAPAAVAIGRGAKAVYNGLAKWSSKSFTQKGMEQAAGNVLVANTSHGPLYAKNADAAAAIEKEIPGLKFSAGQKTGDPGLIKLERTQVRSPGKGGEKYLENIENNNKALSAYYDKHFGGKESSGEVLDHLEAMQTRLNRNVELESDKVASLVGKMPSETPQTAGMRTLDKLERTKEPIKKAMGELESQIPDYPMKFDSMRKAIYDISRDKKMSADAIKSVKSFESDFAELVKKGESTHLAFGVRRTLNDKISQLFNRGDDSAATALMKVRDSLEVDLSAVSDMARSGKVAQYKGKTVFPDELSKELELNSQRLAKLKTAEAPDIPAMQKELNASGHPTMQIMHESKGAFSERLVKDYIRVTGKKPPIASAGSENAMSEISKRNNEIIKILKDVEPGKDVAAAMKAYNDFAEKQYFAKFDRGAVSRVGKRGKEVFGTATRLENIPSNFNTSSGASDLINAIGKESAQDVMHGYYTYDLMQNVAPSGLVDSKKLARWLSKNKEPLRKFGLYEKYSNVAEAQNLADVAAVHVKDFEKSIAGKLLKTDPERAVKVSMMGGNTGKAAKELMDLVGDNPAAKKGLQNSIAELIDKEMKKATTFSKLETLLEKYMPAMKVFYKDDPQKMVALRTMQRAYKTVMRNTKQPLMYGPDTSETLLTEVGKVNVLSRTANVARTLFKVLSAHGKQQVDDIITRSLFDPDYAKTIVDSYKFDIKPKDLKTVINAKVIQLDVYKNRRLAQAAAAGGLLIKGETDENSN